MAASFADLRGTSNYESVAKGDKPETYWLLSVETPICVVASPVSDTPAGKA
jgi:hypothetical protein